LVVPGDRRGSGGLVARSRKGWKFVVFLAVALLSSSGLFLFGRYLASGTLERNAKIVGMVGVLVSAASLVFNILQRRQASAAHAIDEAAQRDRAAETLAEAVQRQWQEEARVRGLRRPAPLRLHWLTTDRPVAASAATIVGGTVGRGRATRVRLHGHSEEVGEKFLALPHRRLVILGEPGAGKTVLAMLLTLDLLGRRQPDDPVPVLLSISSWNSASEHLHAWISRRLMEDYPALGKAATYGPNAAQRLVVGGRVLPILDGLDEMPAEPRAIAIGELDRAHADWPLVLTCRSEEYQEAVVASREVLAAAAVVELQPVTVDEVINFLQDAIPSTDTRWEEVFRYLRAYPGGALAQTLSSPLMAALARTIYTTPDREPHELVEEASSGDQEALERQLLDKFIPAAYADRTTAPGQRTWAPRRRWDATSAHRYLTFLATHLYQRNTRDLVWWELHLAAPRRFIGLGTGLVSGLALGLLTGTAVGFSLRPAVGVVVGLVAWLLVILIAVIGNAPEPERLQLRIRGRLGELTRTLAGQVVIWLVVSTGFFLAIRLAGGSWIGLSTGLWIGVVVGLMVGLQAWLRRPADYKHAVTPQSVFQSDRAVHMAVTLLAFVVGLLFGLVGGLQLGLLPGLLYALLYGLLTALLLGLMSQVAFTAWGWFVILQGWLAVRGQLPRQLMSFLDDAYHRGILRQIGAAYQFRHVRLQEYLAHQPPQERDAQSTTLPA
jgi:hypothetical protein